MKRACLLIVALAVAVIAAPLPAGAQSPAGRVSRIGVLMNLYPADADPPKAFAQRLHDLGYVDGQNVVIDWRYAEGRDDRLPGLAVEMVRRKPDVIVADSTQATRAARQATSTIPIVMMGSADALRTGLVSNLARPGGNITGLTFLLAEMTAKRLQLLKDAVPRLSRVAVLWNPATAFHKIMLKEIDAAAPALRLQPVAIAVRNRDDFGDALAEITRARVDALFVSETMTPGARRRLVEFVTKSRLPAMFSNRDYVSAGGLMSYAPNFPEVFRHAAEYVDKILKGARPGDLPVEQATKFELVVNMKTAMALGLTMPPSISVRADDVIQ